MYGFCPLRHDSCNTECVWYYPTSDTCAVNVLAESLDTLAINDAIKTKMQNGKVISAIRTKMLMAVDELCTDVPTLDDIVKYAARDVLPDRMDVWSDTTQLLYYRLRDMYRAFKSGTITKQQGETQKAQIIRQTERADRDINDLLSQVRHHAELWKRIEHTGTMYAQNRTLDNADRFFEAVYGCRPKERN